MTNDNCDLAARKSTTVGKAKDQSLRLSAKRKIKAYLSCGAHFELDFKSK
jgi:hypothetical protein